MKRVAAVCLLALGVASCGDGNPFSGTTTTTTTTTTGAASGIPAAVSSDLDGFTYNPTSQTLTVTGVLLDADGAAAVYSRAAGLDVPGYVAFSAQDDPLDQHATAYVASLADVQAAVVVTGGQFGIFNGGSAYSRTGGFTSPAAATGDTGLVSYAGDYVGVTDIDGDPTDLLSIPAGTTVDPALLPGQAAVVTGEIFINVDFNDSTLRGVITNRELDANDALLAGGATTLSVPDIILLPGTIDDTGAFTGDVAVGGGTDLDDTGDYGGIFSSTATAVAGGIYIIDHMIADTSEEEEYGIFVLGQCGTSLTSADECAIVDN